MILDELYKNGKLDIITTQPLVIYYKDNCSHNKCYDISKNKWLDVNDIDDSYGLDIRDFDSDYIEVMIPKGVKCHITKTKGFDCHLEYKNIECDLTFDNGEIDSFFEIV